MTLLARWHLRRAARHVSDAMYHDDFAAHMRESPGQGWSADDVAMRTFDASHEWVRAVECLLYAAGLP